MAPSPFIKKRWSLFLAGAYGKSHRILRQGRLHWPHGKPVADTLEIGDWSSHRLMRMLSRKRHNSISCRNLCSGAFPVRKVHLKKDVTSWAGARGLCQLMPATAKEEAQIAKMNLTDLNQLFEPKTNTLLGAQHLKRRLDLLKHPFLAIAAYNAGPGNVRKWRRSLNDYDHRRLCGGHSR